MDLIQKLRLKIDQPLWLINAPDDCAYLFSEFEIKKKVSAKSKVGQLILFALDSIELTHQLSVLSPHISHDTVFWICYPKQSGSMTSDLILMKSWDVLPALGFRGQTSASVNADWSGLRVTNAPKNKPSICDLPMEERQAEGIDFVARNAWLPADAEEVVNKFEGMLLFFNAMAFTHKKEYVLSIVEAKQPETRARRINKMAEMLLEKMNTAPKTRRRQQ